MAGSSDKVLQVELVAADRLVWSGEANVVNARTAGGEIGILANHMPVLSLLEAGVVEIETASGETWLAAVDDGFLSVAGNRVSILATRADLASDIDAGFLSVADNRVSILSERAEMSHEIDLEKARQDLERAQASGENDDEAKEAVRRAEARIRAAERAS